MFKTLREKAGYISIETVVVAGLMLCLGAFIIGSLFARTVQAIGSVARSPRACS